MSVYLLFLNPIRIHLNTNGKIRNLEKHTKIRKLKKHIKITKLKKHIKIRKLENISKKENWKRYKNYKSWKNTQKQNLLLIIILGSVPTQIFFLVNKNQKYLPSVEPKY